MLRKINTFVSITNSSKVYEIYKMDFDLFEYDATPFFELCSTGKQDPI